MKTKQKTQIQTLKHVIGLIAIIGFLTGGLPSLYAEENAETRWDKVQQWLDKHPKIKEKVDKDDNGEVSRDEFKAGYGRWLKHRSSRRPYPGYEGYPYNRRRGGPGASPDRNFPRRYYHHLHCAK